MFVFRCTVVRCTSSLSWCSRYCTTSTSSTRSTQTTYSTTTIIRYLLFSNFFVIFLSRIFVLFAKFSYENPSSKLLTKIKLKYPPGRKNEFAHIVNINHGRRILKHTKYKANNISVFITRDFFSLFFRLKIARNGF